MTTQNSTSSEQLAHFVEELCGDENFRIEHDFGNGFVRLRSSEAERRQAAQDIRSSEDIVIELLRNARDAKAKHIHVATWREGRRRFLTVIDDGIGIPQHMQQSIFEPRVTSKLDTAHMDKWGIHGRGMALFSVSVNALNASVCSSEVNKGTSIVVETSLDKLPEKTDQSTFPYFEIINGTHCMRGPRNILRTVAEFALEHRNDCEVYFGSATEIASTIYAYGVEHTQPVERVFESHAEDLQITKRLACATDADDFARRCGQLGLPLSSRSARRILDDDIPPLPTMLQQIENKLQADSGMLTPESANARDSQELGTRRDQRKLKLDPQDLDALKDTISSLCKDLSDRYYFEFQDPSIRIEHDAIRIGIPIEKLR